MTNDKLADEIAQPVEATPETDAADEIARAKLHGPDQRTLDALEITLSRALAAERDFIQVHKNCIEARERAEKAERALSLAQTENAGHIRIEDELKSDLAQAQARCAELEKLLAEVIEDRYEANYSLGTALVDRIDAALAAQNPGMNR